MSEYLYYYFCFYSCSRNILAEMEGIIVRYLLLLLVLLLLLLLLVASGDTIQYYAMTVVMFSAFGRI